eukprot:maker-scaffold17_size721972-snap-gene-6.25 protein:Tk09983 transcript:maker-scaffold17_size721972-snap-gene-6.25-mRNA-1 annotation:"hypothetical protein DAPPUDRAFT_309863"
MNLSQFLSWIWVVLGLLAGVQSLKLEYDIVEPIAMGTHHNVTMRLSFDPETDEEATWPANQGVKLTFNLTDKVSWALDIKNESILVTPSQIRGEQDVTLVVFGTILGFNDMQVLGQFETLSPGMPTARPPYEPNQNNRRKRRRTTTTTTTTKDPWGLDETVDFSDYYNYDDYSESRRKRSPESAPEDAKAPEEADSGETPTSENSEDIPPAIQVTLNPTEPILMRKIHLVVVVKDQTMNDLFTLVLTIMIIANTINMGGQLDLEIIKEVFKKPVGPIVGFVSQFILMPLFAFGVGWLVSSNTLFRLGLFVLGCCPGGTGSNFWCILLKGDINLSITMTFVSTVAALGMMPLWLWIMGPFLTEEDLIIPYSQLMIGLVSLIAPIALGMFIRYKWKRAAGIMDKIIVPFTLLTVIFIFTVGVYVNLFIFQLMTGAMVAAGFLVVGAGYLFGAGLAWVFRLNRKQIVAVSIETAFQNGGIAFILLKVSLPPPYGELASVAPVCQLVLTAIPLWLILGLWKIYSKCIRPRLSSNKVEPIQAEYTAVETETIQTDNEIDDKPILKISQSTQTQVA